MKNFAFPGRWRALGTAAGREVMFGLPTVDREVRKWRDLAQQIPDPTLRRDAVTSLADKRYYVDGAALFWILPKRRDDQLLALLVALQTIANFLDYASERGAAARGCSGGNLMSALVDAVDVGGPFQDYYAGHPQHDDGGYLRALVSRCRSTCATLPRYELARPLLRREASRAAALELTHDPQPARRDAALRAWALREHPEASDATWEEHVGSATSLLAVIALLAVAADRATTVDDLRSTAAAYAPWVGAAGVILDSFIDQHNDLITDAWSFVGYFGDDEAVVQRGVQVISRCRVEIASLRHADRHAVIFSMMLAMFLTSDSARRDPLAPSARALLRAGGPMAMALAPVLRAWRLAYRLRD